MERPSLSLQSDPGRPESGCLVGHECGRLGTFLNVNCDEDLFKPHTYTQERST